MIFVRRRRLNNRSAYPWNHKFIHFIFIENNNRDFVYLLFQSVVSPLTPPPPLCLSPAGAGEASRGLQAHPSRFHVRREDPEHRFQPDEREAGGAVGSGELHQLSHSNF